MEAWIEFGRGPLFRLAFSLMVLGLLRLVLLTVAGIAEAYKRSSDKILAWGEIGRQTLAWLVPVNRLWRKRPLYSTASFLFHVGLLGVPLFLAAHLDLWQRSIGWAWSAIPQKVADGLTLLTIATGLGLFCGRVFDRRARALSRPQDYVWPLLLVVPFLTGYLCSNARLEPRAYQVMMLLHVYSGILIMLMIPFTKIAHCVLAPLSQLVSAVSWKFAPGAGDKVAATLGRAERPSWMAKAQRGEETAPAAVERKEVLSR